VKYRRLKAKKDTNPQLPLPPLPETEQKEVDKYEGYWKYCIFTTSKSLLTDKTLRKAISSSSTKTGLYNNYYSANNIQIFSFPQ
jgi:hypothetical protein